MSRSRFAGPLTVQRLAAAGKRRLTALPDMLAWRLPFGRAARNRRRLEAWRDRHRGRRCFVLGNGPSLAGMDLSPLANELSFGANRIYLLEEPTGFLPSFYCCSNELVLDQFAPEIDALPMPRFVNWNRRLRFPHDREDLLFFRLRLELADRFRTEPARALSSGGTVTFVALQLAFYMGFREVILIGVDHRFAATGTPNVAEVRSQVRDQDHFHPDYFPRGSRWQPPDLLRSEIAYALAREAYERAGGQILDATVGGACEVFDKVDYSTLF